MRSAVSSLNCLTPAYPTPTSLIPGSIPWCILSTDLVILPIHPTFDQFPSFLFSQKIVERAVRQQLYNYLSQNHLLSPSQHGFRHHHLTETALISITDQILSANDRGDLSFLCLLDLSNCFDVIDHQKLLTKLQMHGVDTGWFSAYLCNHTQRQPH